MSQDQDSNESRASIFSRIFFFRMLAILLFVALGTFAVFQSVKKGDASNGFAQLANGETVGQSELNETGKGNEGSAPNPETMIALVNNNVETNPSLPFPAPSKSTGFTPSSPVAAPELPSKTELASSGFGQQSGAPAVKSFGFSAPAGDPPAENKPNQADPPAPRTFPNQALANNAPNESSPPTGLPNLNRPPELPGAVPALPVSSSTERPPTNPLAPFTNKLGQSAQNENPPGENTFPNSNPAETTAQQMESLIASGKQRAADALAASANKSSNALSNLAEAANGMLTQTPVPGPPASEAAPSQPTDIPSVDSPTNSIGQPFAFAKQGLTDNPATKPSNPGNDSATGFGGQSAAPVSSRQFPGGNAPQPESFENPNRPAAQMFSGNESRVVPGAQPASTNFQNNVPAGPASTHGPNIPVSPGRNINTAATTSPGNTLATPGETSLEGIQTPSIAIEKIAPREIQVNQPAKFAIVVRNVGRVAASNVQVHDRIPAGTTLISSTPQPATNSDNLVWNLGELPPGQERKIELELRPERPGEIGSVAQVTFATQASARTRVTRPELSVEHTAPPQVMIGSPVSLTITVRNNGDGPANNVVVQEKVPEQLKYNDGIRDLEYEVGTLAPGQSKSVTLTLQTAAVGQFRNVVGAIGDGGLSATHETTIQVISPKLVVTSEGPHRRFLKRDTTHSFSVQNTGTASATNLDLVAQLPRSVRFVSANNQGQFDPGSHAVYWSLAELRATQKASVTVETQPVETGIAKIDFIARADLNQRTEIAHDLTIEHLVDIYFEIDDVTDHIETGATTEYRLRIVNQGTKPAENVRLLAEFDPGIRPDSVSGGLRGETRGQTVTFEPIPSINPGAEIIAIVTATGVGPGEHRVAVNLQTDGREINITKEESTRVYADR